MRGYEDLQKSLHSELSGHIQRNRELNRLGEPEKPRPSNSSSQGDEESSNTQQTNGTIKGDAELTEQSELPDNGPQSPTTRLNPRTLNVKYVADPSSLPMETEASTANNDPLNLVSFDGDVSVRTTSQMSSRNKSSTKPEAMQPPPHHACNDSFLRRDYKDDLDSPSDLPVANSIHLLTHPLQAAMAPASPLILSHATLVMGHGPFADFPSSTLSPPTNVDSNSATEQPCEIPTVNNEPQAESSSPDVDPTTTKSDFSPPKISTNEEAGFITDPLNVLGSGDSQTAGLFNGSVEPGHQTNTASEVSSEPVNDKDGMYIDN